MFKINDSNIYEADFTTYTYNTDACYHARLEFYFQMMQEASGHHAGLRNCSIPELNAEGKTWVITRSHMKINRYTHWPEVMHLETWVKDGFKLHFPRATRIKDEQGNVVMDAQSWWAVLDLEHNFRPCKPQEISQKLIPIQEDDTEHQYDPAMPKWIAYDNQEAIELFVTTPQIKYLDTDFNHHVNNISYVGWVLDSLPTEFRDAYKVAEVDVQWMRQTYRNDNLFVHTAAFDINECEKPEPHFLHKIIRKELDGTETIVFEAVTTWKDRSALFVGLSK